MTASSDILQEYLIQVGVKADEGALAKLAGILSSTENIVKGLVTGLIAGITAVEAFVAVSTNELEDLYWATKRLKSSAADIKDFELRMEKAGSTSADAREALESLSQFRRSNPFGDAFIGLIGVQAEGRGTVDVMGSLINRFKQLNQQGQYWLAIRYAERLGIDERTLWSMVNTSAKAEDVYDRLYKRLHINTDQAVQDAHEYRNKLRDMGAEFTVLAQTIGLKMMPAAEKFLDWMLHSEEAKRLGDNVGALAGVVGNLASSGASLLAAMPKEALEFGIVGFFLFGRKGAAILALLGAAKSLVGYLAGDKNTPDNKRLVEAGEGGKNSKFFDNFFSEKGKNDRFLKSSRWLYDHGLGFLNADEFNATYAEYQNRKSTKRKITEPQSHHDVTPAAKPSPNGLYPLGVRSNNPGNLQPGGVEKVYETPEAGMRDMAKTLLRYGRQGLTTIQDIISKYAPEFDKYGNRINDTAAYIKNVAREMEKSATQPLRLQDPEELRKLMAAMIRVEQGYVPYGSGMIGDAARDAIDVGDKAISLHPKISVNVPKSSQPHVAVNVPPASQPKFDLPSNKPISQASLLDKVSLAPVTTHKSIVISQGDTNVTIHGAKEPKETAKQIKQISDRRYGDLVRNLSTAVT